MRPGASSPWATAVSGTLAAHVRPPHRSFLRRPGRSSGRRVRPHARCPAGGRFRRRRLRPVRPERRRSAAGGNHLHPRLRHAAAGLVRASGPGVPDAVRRHAAPARAHPNAALGAGRTRPVRPGQRSRRDSRRAVAVWRAATLVCGEHRYAGCPHLPARQPAGWGCGRRPAARRRRAALARLAERAADAAVRCRAKPCPRGARPAAGQRPVAVGRRHDADLAAGALRYRVDRSTPHRRACPPGRPHPAGGAGIGHRVARCPARRSRPARAGVPTRRRRNAPRTGSMRCRPRSTADDWKPSRCMRAARAFTCSGAACWRGCAVACAAAHCGETRAGDPAPSDAAGGAGRRARSPPRLPGAGTGLCRPRRGSERGGLSRRAPAAARYAASASTPRPGSRRRC